MAPAISYPITRPLSRRVSGASLGRAGTSGPVAFAYYVAASGNDANPGTQSQPWQTLAKVAAQSFFPNTTVYLNGGDTFTGPLTLPSVSGTVGLPIKYTSYGTGQARINSAANADGIAGTNLSYVTIDNLNLTGPGSASTSGFGINLQWSTTAVFPGVSVTNCNVSGFASTGIWSFCNTAGAQTNGLLVSGNTVTGCTYGDTTTSGTAGILVRGVTGFQTAAKNNLNPHITLNTCKNNLGVTGSVNHCGSGILLLHANGGLMDYNYADNNGQNCNNAAGPAGIWMGFSTLTKMRYNVATNTKTAASDGHGYDMDGGCDNCTTEFNFSSGNAGFGVLCFEYDNANFTTNNNNIIRGNISFNDISGGLRLVSGGTHANSGQAYNNRFVGRTTTVGGIVKLEDNGGGLTWTVANNSIETQNTGTTDLVLTSAGHAPNCFFYGNNYLTAGTFRITWNGTAYSTMALWRAGVVGQETISAADTSKSVTGTYVSPSGSPYIMGVGNNFDPARPLETSPLLNAGVDLFANFSINPGSTDLFGSPLSTSGPWSIGPSAMKSAVKSVVLSTTGSGSWTVPADFAQLLAVDCIGAGGSNNASLTSAGGGAFARSALTSITSSWVPGTTTVSYFVGAAVSGAAGQDTTFGATSLAAAVALGPNSAVGAQGGAANSGSTGGAGGQASASVGTTAFSGGKGGDSTAFSNGGAGGAAGVFGNGANGGAGAAATGRGAGGGGGANGGGVGAVATSTIGGGGGIGPLGNGGGPGGNTGAGSAGVGGSGGGGAGASGGTGGAGGAGSDWSTNGSGGGGGAGLGAAAATNVGGAFGGGAGSRELALGGQGGIRILYKTSASL